MRLLDPSILGSRRSSARAARSTVRSGLALTILVGLLMAPIASGSGVIRGRLLTTSTSTKSPTGDGTQLVAQRGASDAVIYVVQVPDKVEAKAARHDRKGPKAKLPRIVQEKRAFVPRVLVTTAGSSVEFANLDRVYHNAFSVSAAKRFDLGKYAPGHVDTVSFPRAGVANLHCDIHPDESAFVVVVPNHFFTRPDSFGRFKLPKLPPGQYTLRGWHSRLGELKQDVTMPRHGDLVVDLRF